jgi:positive regulator of sigma E activity
MQFIIIYLKIEIPILLKNFISEKTINSITFSICKDTDTISFLIAICGLIIGYSIFNKYKKLNRELEKQQK